ncbi:MAG TPA: hypothetical protein PLC98_12720 [Anaerolineales bacterium]|nr:hypothetical protein [Anaerolineales bacterium]
MLPRSAHPLTNLVFAAALLGCQQPGRAAPTEAPRPQPTATAQATPTLAASASPATSTVTLQAATAQMTSPTAPTAEPTLDPIEQEAANTLRDFLTLLHFRRYAEAAPLYGGSYEDLAGFLGPFAGSMEPVALWQKTCDNYFLQCLLPKAVSLDARTEASLFFRVSFYNPDGSTFTLGPCCGASEADMPPRSEFSYEVTVSEGHYLVLGTPPYVP